MKKAENIGLQQFLKMNQKIHNLVLLQKSEIGS